MRAERITTIIAALTLFAGAAAAWMNVHTRLTALETDVAQIKESQTMMVREILDVTKNLHRIRGRTKHGPACPPNCPY